MLTDPEGTILAAFALFCRVGACFMLMPGVASMRVPMNVRLFVAAAVSLALLPILWESIYGPATAGPLDYLKLIGSELAIGGLIGVVARIYVLALQFAGAALALVIGFNSLPGTTIDENDPQSSLTTLITTVGLLVLFSLDYHHQVVRALAASYEFLPADGLFSPQTALITLADALSASFSITLPLVGPFIVYGLLANIAVGLVNKLSPQIPVYFIALPFILAGGLFLFFLAVGDFFRVFGDGFATVFLGR